MVRKIIISDWLEIEGWGRDGSRQGATPQKNLGVSRSTEAADSTADAGVTV